MFGVPEGKGGGKESVVGRDEGVGSIGVIWRGV